MDPIQTLLPTPAAPTQGVTDDQIADLRRYAEALRTTSQQPVHHWLQGVSNVIGDVMSGFESNRADQLRAKQQQDYITALSGGVPAPDPYAAPTPNASSPDVRNTTAALRGGASPPAEPQDPASAVQGNYYTRLAQIESGGNPNAVSPGGKYTGLYQLGPEERAQGVEAVTERNRAALSQALQREPTQAELYMAHQQGIGGALSHMANPDLPAWRNMRNTAEGQQKGDAWARQSIWGNMTPQMRAQYPGGVDTVPSRDFMGMWAQRWNGGANPPPVAPPDLPEQSQTGVKRAALPPAAQQQADVLAGRPPAVAPAAPPVSAPTQPAALPPGATAAPQDQVRQMAVGLIRAGMAPAQAITTAAGMVQARQGFAAQYTPNEWGQVVRTAPGQLPSIVPGAQIGPGKPTTRYGIQGFETIGPDGTPQFRPAPLPTFPGSPAPAGGPTPTPGTAPPATAAPWRATPGGPPPPLPTNLDEARTYDDRMAAWKVAQTKGAEEGAVLAAKRTPEQAAFENQQAREKEQARIEAETSPEALAGKARGTALVDQAKAYVTRAQTIEKQATDAQAELPQLNLLKRVIANPEFYSGIFSKQVGDLKQLGDKIGLAPSQTATLMQFAKKLGAAGSLEQIREMGQQGAVRVPEMHMIEKSNFDPDNTQEANAAVVEIRARLAQRSMELADMANKYADAHGGLLDRGFDQQVRDYYKDKPLISDDELQQYDQLLDRKRPASTERGPAQALSPTLPPGSYQRVQ